MSVREDEAKPTRTRTELRVAAMRARLVDVAEGLVVEGGVEALSADEVARRADVSLQTVYNRIGGQQALLIAVAERAMEETRTFLVPAYSQGGSVQERLRHIGESYIRLAFVRPQSFKIFANPPEDPEAIARIAALANEQHEQLTNLLREGIDNGELNRDLIPEAAATALWGMLNGMLSVALRHDAMRPDSVAPQALVDAAMTIIESGTKRTAEPDRS